MSEYWRACGDGYYTLCIHPTPSLSSKRVAWLKAFGFITFAHLYLLRGAPIPVSPHLLSFIIDGMKAFGYDEEFVRAVDPSAARAVKPWSDWKKTYPRTPPAILGQSHAVNALLNAAGIEV